VQVHRCLRAPGAARGPQPERDVLGTCPCRTQFGRILGKPLIPMQVSGLRFANDDDVPEKMLRP
jgi:hypothetical protein